MTEEKKDVTNDKVQKVTITPPPEKFVELTEQHTYDLLGYLESRPLGETLGIYGVVVAALQKAFPEKVQLNQ